ncbi:acyl-CoA dehydrogenase family protein [Hyphobacterium sp. CCMP332]|jgi:acyl-CoA dehydrogenase|uniref:acyl-CoA dehydrogenase family protein n=1 Tax=Hyphobacterium sp. CCMP332 TaxID=2749086 RepID=UPI00164F70DC|nr:acyl-CoA dehydrogenase family protein [Hyphobacterium sp. CCMP332]QNL19355.1 acyl-CoA dehydrogenase family protein [Hyphobacterium sp. CCMP332]
MLADPLNVKRPEWLDQEDVNIFYEAVKGFIEKECLPHGERWEKTGVVDREVWTKAGEAGLLCPAAPEEYGGAGGDWRHDYVFHMAVSELGVDGWGASLHNSIVAPYIWHYGSEEQKKRLLPKMISGEYVGAIAMSEPAAGSDLQGIKTTAKKDGNGYRINGSKTFITNGGTANFIIVVAKTDATAGAKGTSLFMVETDGLEGFRRGRLLDKVGLKGQDTAELFFDDMWVPADALLGPEEGQGFIQLMQQLPQERLQIAVQGVGMMKRALDETIRYVKERHAFGKPIMAFQNTQFKLAELKTKATIAEVFCQHCSDLLLKGELDAATASMAKYWVSDTQCELIDECVQLHGGYGFMNEYPVARMWRDARVQRIYGGTNEIMKLLISRTL